MGKAAKDKRTRFNLLLCLLVAAACWFMMKMSKTYRVDYTYRLTLRNCPETRNPSYQSDSLVVLTLEDKGLALLGADLRSKKLALDYESLLTEYQKNRNSVRITHNQLMDYLRTDRRFSNSLQEINLSALHFTFVAVQPETKPAESNSRESRP